MTLHLRTIAVCFATLVVSFTGVRLAAQMGPQQHQGQMHAQAMQQQPMMAAHQMMRNADAMMANAATMMRNFAVVPPNMPHHQQHQQMMQSLEGMLGNMRQFHGTIQNHLHDPALMQHRQAFKDMEEACRNLEQMAGAFEAMTKHMNQAFRNLPNAPRK